MTPNDYWARQAKGRTLLAVTLLTVAGLLMLVLL